MWCNVMLIGSSVGQPVYLIMKHEGLRRAEEKRSRFLGRSKSKLKH